MANLIAHRHYPQNIHGRDFFVGDIHGKYLLLLRLLNKIHFDGQVDRLFSVGDVIDRGEASFNCLLLAEHHWFIPVVGNHEQFLHHSQASEIEEQFIWYQNGGGWWATLGERARALAQHIVTQHFAYSVSVDTDAGRVGVVHAEFPQNHWPLASVDINERAIYQLLWCRQRINKGQGYCPPEIEFLVSGHTPLAKPVVHHRQLFIDTGCGHISCRTIPHPQLTAAYFSKKYIHLYAQAERFYHCATLAI